MNALPLLLLALAWHTSPQDPRDDYDVEAYDLELAVRPAEQLLEGAATLTATALVDDFQTVLIDLHDLHQVLLVEDTDGGGLEYERIPHGIRVELQEPVAAGTSFTVRVLYKGKPEGGGFDGFHWAKTASGKPWINTACQGLGAHYWYPCKASFFNPDDKPARVSMAITCPADLYGVSNGALEEVRDGGPVWFDTQGAAWKTYQWRHGYPLETYSVTLNVGPYVVVEDELELPGLDEPVPYFYYVLPENAEKAALQFQQVPELLSIYSEAFGPWPYPASKFALVETNFWGMEHSTAVAYGSSYPEWCRSNGAQDEYAGRNRWFDYILIHEVAHEWWGNAVSATHWGHFWIHEGFGTYAEGVYVEFTRTRDDADRYFAEMGERIPADRGSLYCGEDPSSGDAYNGLIYSKGACVLNTLRHYVDDDEAWWQSLREFNQAFRYGNASTEDFQAVLEKNTGEEWGRFFQEWFYGQGTPALKVQVRTKGRQILVEVDNTSGTFLVPFDVAWDGQTKRLWVEPGEHTFTIECDAKPENVSVDHLDRVLGKHEVRIG